MKQDLSLKKLNGIRPKGVKPKPNSTLERIFELEKKFFDDVRPEYDSAGDNHTLADMILVPDVFDAFEKNHASNFEFEPRHLEEYVCGRQNIAETTIKSIADAKTIGLFSAALLSLLDKRSKELGKNLRVEINGGKNQFDYLFNYVRSAHTLIIENIKSNYICNHFGHSKSESDFLLVKDCRGDVFGASLAWNAPISLIVLANNCFKEAHRVIDGGTSNLCSVIYLGFENQTTDSLSATRFRGTHNTFCILQFPLVEKSENDDSINYEISRLEVRYPMKYNRVNGKWKYNNVPEPTLQDIFYKEISEGSGTSNGFFNKRKITLENNVWCPDNFDAWTKYFADDKKALKLYNNLLKEFRFDEIINLTLKMNGKSAKEIEYYSKKINEIKTEVMENYIKNEK